MTLDEARKKLDQARADYMSRRNDYAKAFAAFFKVAAKEIGRRSSDFEEGGITDERLRDAERQVTAVAIALTKAIDAVEQAAVALALLEADEEAEVKRRVDEEARKLMADYYTGMDFIPGPPQRMAGQTDDPTPLGAVRTELRVAIDNWDSRAGWVGASRCLLRDAIHQSAMRSALAYYPWPLYTDHQKDPVLSMTFAARVEHYENQLLTTFVEALDDQCAT
uniref:Uncharacterized protein n=1 Tax=viral metagenome TaxID=1070528 RepID=A0A6M3Y3N0_9ZZZZ